MSGRMTFNHTKQLHMVTRNVLADEIESLYERGKNVVCVTPTREFRYSDLGPTPLCDYLIVYVAAPQPAAGDER